MVRPVRYEQLQKHDETDHEHILPGVVAESTCSRVCCTRIVTSLFLILLYFALSIGLTFYQQWLLKVNINKKMISFSYRIVQMSYVIY